jgi:hypothetical protein
VFTHVDTEHPVQIDAIGVLSGHHDRVQPHRLVTRVLDGDLGLAVRPPGSSESNG